MAEEIFYSSCDYVEVYSNQHGEVGPSTATSSERWRVSEGERLPSLLIRMLRRLVIVSPKTLHRPLIWLMEHKWSHSSIPIMNSAKRMLEAPISMPRGEKPKKELKGWGDVWNESGLMVTADTPVWKTIWGGGLSRLQGPPTPLSTLNQSSRVSGLQGWTALPHVAMI